MAAKIAKLFNPHKYISIKYANPHRIFSQEPSIPHKFLFEIMGSSDHDFHHRGAYFLKK